MPTTRSISPEHTPIDQAGNADFEDDASTSGIAANATQQSQRSESKYKPVWSIWQDRPVATVQEAICLLHDIHPPSYSKLDTDDARNKHFRPHLKTLKHWITYVRGIRIAPGEDYDGMVGEGTFIVLRDFVEQVRTGALFKDVGFSEGFRELNPPLPHEFEEEMLASSFSSESAQLPKPNENGNEKLNKAWARLVVLMAAEHYKFVPVWPPEELSKPKKVHGLYQPLATLAKELEFPLIQSRDTVRDAFVDAVRIIGEDGVRKIQSRLEQRKKTASSSSEDGA